VSRHDIQDIFERLVVPLWLRPERALWDSHAFAAVRSFLRPPHDFERPALDFGCLDGFPSFVMMGGSLSMDTDEYADLVGGTTAASTSGDYFAVHRPDATSTVIQSPAQKFSVGVSWREEHLKKAARLSFYDELHLAELANPLRQYPKGAFKTIWSPNLPWCPEPQLRAILFDHVRLLAPFGRILTIVPDTRQLDAEIFAKFQFMPKRWLSEMDRGIGSNLTRNARSDLEWRDFFNGVGLKVLRHERFLPQIVGATYQIGFRPMFPALMEAYGQLRQHDASQWREVKRHWIETLVHFFEPLCDPMVGCNRDENLLWHAYELSHVE
jgi:hypothetical protein